MKGLTPLCQYCHQFSVLTNGADIYPHRPDLHKKAFYKCPNCIDVYVGCHPNTTKPLGVLANYRLRKAKSRAHSAFDPLWKYLTTKHEQRNMRKRLYAKLASLMAIESSVCHIGMFDIDQCDDVVGYVKSGQLP